MYLFFIINFYQIMITKNTYIRENYNRLVFHIIWHKDFFFQSFAI